MSSASSASSASPASLFTSSKDKTIRVFLLPPTGAPTECLIPAGGDGQMKAMQASVGGFVQRGFGGVGKHGSVAMFFDEEAAIKNPRPEINVNVPDCQSALRGPLLVVLEQGGKLKSIPLSVKPEDWLTLYSK